MDRPVQDAAWTQHASAEEERAGQLVVVHILQEDQDNRVPAFFNDLVKRMMDCKSGDKKENFTQLLYDKTCSISQSFICSIVVLFQGLDLDWSYTRSMEKVWDYVKQKQFRQPESTDQRQVPHIAWNKKQMP